MEGGGFFRGTSQDQDTRFSNKIKKLIKETKFPKEFDTKVDMKKVKLELIKPWISQKITKMLGFEDEVLIGYIFGMLEDNQYPDPKVMQINLTGFLAEESKPFLVELWKLLISAQNNIGGIPQEFLEKKKEELKQRKAEQDRINAELKKKGLDNIQQQQNDDVPKNAESKGDENQAAEIDRKDKSRDDRDRDRSRDDRDRRDRKDDRDRSYRDDRDRRDSRRYDRDYRDRDRDRSRDYDRGHRSSHRDDKRSSHYDRDRSRDYDRRHYSSDEEYERERREKRKSYHHSRDDKDKRSRRSPDNSVSPKDHDRQSRDNDEDNKEAYLREKALKAIKKKNNDSDDNGNHGDNNNNHDDDQ